MKEIDQLAEALVSVVAHTIVLPIRIVRLVAKAVKPRLKKPNFGALGQWKKTGSKKSRIKVERAGGALDKFKLKYEDLPNKKGKNNGRSRNNK